MNYDDAVRRLRGIWRDVFLLGLPLLCVTVLAGTYFTDFKVDFGYNLGLDDGAYWLLASFILIAGLIGAKYLATQLLSPNTIASKKPLDSEDDDFSKAERAELRIKERLLIQLSIIDAPVIIFFLHAFLTGTPTSIGLALAYCILIFFVIQPDWEALLRETVQELEKTKGG